MSGIPPSRSAARLSAALLLLGSFSDRIALKIWSLAFACAPFWFRMYLAFPVGVCPTTSLVSPKSRFSMPRQTSAVMQIPMSWVYLSLPVSGALMIVYSLLNLADLSRGISHHVDVEEDVALGEE